MKQIQECLDRAWSGQQPLKKKWRASFIFNEDIGRELLYLCHYHHLILIYDKATHQFLYTWWEKPADKRGFDSAIAYINDKFSERHYDTIPSGEFK